MSIKPLLLLMFLVGIAGQALADAEHDQPDQTVAPIIISHDKPTAQAVVSPAWPEENILKGNKANSNIIFYREYSGQLDVGLADIKPPLKVRDGRPFPNDQVVIVLDGSILTQLQGEPEPRLSQKGDILMFPKGTVIETMEWLPGESGFYKVLGVVPPSAGYEVVDAAGEKGAIKGVEQGVTAKSDPFNVWQGETNTPTAAAWARGDGSHSVYRGEIDVTLVQLRTVSKAASSRRLPFDRAVFVLQGEQHVRLQGEQQQSESRIYRAGDIVLFPASVNVAEEVLIPGDEGFYRAIIITPP